MHTDKLQYPNLYISLHAFYFDYDKYRIRDKVIAFMRDQSLGYRKVPNVHSCIQQRPQKTVHSMLYVPSIIAMEKVPIYRCILFNAIWNVYE